MTFSSSPPSVPVRLETEGAGKQLGPLALQLQAQELCPDGAVLRGWAAE